MIFRVSEIFFMINQPPKDGVCKFKDLINLNVDALSEIVIECKDWIDPEDVGVASFCVFYYEDDTPDEIFKKVIYCGVNDEIILVLPPGEFLLYIEIKDYWGAVTVVELPNILVRTTSIDVQEIMQKVENITVTKDQGKMSLIILAASSIRDSFNITLSESSDENPFFSEEESKGLLQINDLNKLMMEQMLNSVNIETRDLLHIITNIANKVIDCIATTNFGVFTVDMEMRSMALSLINKIANAVVSLNTTDPLMEESFVSNFLNIVDNVVLGINKILEVKRASPSDMKLSSDLEYDTDIGTDINLVISTNNDILKRDNVMDTFKKEVGYVTTEVMKNLHTISNSLERNMLCNEDLKSKSSSSCIVIRKFNSQNINNSEENFNSSIKTPPDFNPFNENNSTDCLTSVYRKLSFVSEISEDKNDLVSPYSETVSLEIFANKEQTSFSVKDNPFEISISRRIVVTLDNQYINGTEFANPVTNMVYHELNLPKNSQTLVIQLTPVTEFPSSLVVLINKDRMPYKKNFKQGFLLHEMSKDENNTYSVLVNDLNYPTITRMFIGVGVLNNLNSTNLDEDILYQSTAEINFSYYISVFTTGCYFFNKTIKAWSNSGLSVAFSSVGQTICKSSHLTDFTSGYSNIADFRVSYQLVLKNFGFEDNLTIYITIIIFVVTYVFMIIWARRKDKCDFQKLGVIPLPDNKPEDKYLYEVTFHTGSDAEAATESNVNFILEGENGISDIRFLPQGNRDIFYRHSINSFVMTTESSLGNIKSLRIFHDNSGIPPYDTWQLSLVVVRDLQEKKKTVFYTNSWLALDREDSFIDKTFKPISLDENKTFSEKYYVNVNNAVNQDNMWVSIFLKSPGSRYSRKERVTVAAVYIFLSMCLTAVYYFMTGEFPDDSSFRLGPFMVSIEQIGIGILASLATLPLVFIIEIVFRKSGPRKLVENRAITAINNQKEFIKQSEPKQEVRFPEIDINSYKSRKDEGQKLLLPWWMRIFAWLICISAIIGSAAFVFLNGISWGDIKTSRWFSSFIFAFLVSIFIIEWINVALSSVFSTCISKDISTLDIDCDEELPHLKNDEEYIYENNISISVDQIRGVNENNYFIGELHKTITKNKEMWKVLKDITKYLLFLLILVILVSGHTDYNTFLLRGSLTDLLVTETKFYKVSINHIYIYNNFVNVQKTTYHFGLSVTLIFNNVTLLAERSRLRPVVF